MFEIVHIYDVDGGFGDAVEKERVIGYVETEEDAKAYVAKYSRPEVYDIPYSRLWCHQLEYRKMSNEMLNMSVDPFANDYFSDARASNIAVLTDVVWDKKDKNYEDDFPTEIDVASYDDVKRWFCDLAGDYCHAISFKKDGVLYTNPSAVD